jgi:hypothetical protein
MLREISNLFPIREQATVRWEQEWMAQGSAATANAGALPFESHRQPIFVLGIFKIGSHDLFIRDGFKPRSS